MLDNLVEALIICRNLLNELYCYRNGQRTSKLEQIICRAREMVSLLSEFRNNFKFPKDIDDGLAVITDAVLECLSHNTSLKATSKTF